ncbi:MAG: DNA-3-methyladenine glycosylase [Gemmatimonadetes bacterium]|nr:DNA-3-methyladenine glycosylase [Gemmatimonadota bacterium]
MRVRRERRRPRRRAPDPAPSRSAEWRFPRTRSRRGCGAAGAAAAAGDPAPPPPGQVTAGAGGRGDATPGSPAWRSYVESPGGGAPFPTAFFARPVEVVARELLGARLVSDVAGGRTSGVIVETEAYGGPDDPASHAATRGGRTPRNAIMFGPAGLAYVYRIYGMHWCVNVVTGETDQAQAVLVRALAPLEGLDLMTLRRGRVEGLTSGPGRLCQALGITGELYGHDLGTPPLRVLPGWTVPDAEVLVSGRIGIRHAADRPLRFHVRGEPHVSR